MNEWTFLAAQLYSPSLELVVLVVAIAADALLAYAVYRSNTKSATNIFFSLLSIFTILWLGNNYLTNHILSSLQYFDLALILGRLGILWAAPMSALFLLLAHTIPSDTIQMRRPYFYAVVGATLLMMFVNVSPYAFVGVEIGNGGLQLVPGIGLLPFAVLSTVFSILAVYVLVRKYLHAKDVIKKQLGLVLAGILIMLGLIITTVLVPLIVSNTLPFLAFTPLYALVFLGMTAYAITTYQLFDVKVLVTQALTLVIWIVLFAKLFGEDSRNAQIIDGLILLFMIIFGILLVRSVRREVRQREEIERLSREKSEFMSFASHEIRNPLTAMKGYASLIIEGDLGEVSPSVRDAATKILVTGNQIVALIAQFLDKSKLELGQLQYNLVGFDLGESVRVVVDGLRPFAQERGLTLTLNIAPDLRFPVHADEAKVKEVIGNVIDNAIKYTRAGSIAVSAERAGNIARVSVADTGAGIAPEVLPQLFKKFSRADAQKANLFGTGLGLYLSRTFVEAQGGKLWAESEGAGKGSRFFIELPMAKQGG